MDFRAKQEAEAVERMKLLELYPQVVNEFEKKQVLYKSEFFGILYWLDEDEKKIVKDFEDETHAVVYHIIKSLTPCGTMLSIFYVSDEESEWPLDKESMENGVQLCYVKNMLIDEWSEFGYISFQKCNGGLMRTA